MRIWELDDLAPRDGWPAVLLLHGGGWTGGSPEEFTAFGPKLARNGWYVGAVRYRLADEHRISEALEDVLAAIEFMHHQQVDHKRVALWGFSAGAHLALLAAQRVPDQLAAVVCVAPATDPSQLPEFDSLFAPEERVALAPMSAAPMNSPPILLVHGTNDAVVPFDQSRRFAERNPAAELLPVPQGDHSLRWPPLRAASARRQAVSWLRGHLIGPERGSKWKRRGTTKQ
jgi:acetyl esterase/lipase